MVVSDAVLPVLPVVTLAEIPHPAGGDARINVESWEVVGFPRFRRRAVFVVFRHAGLGPHHGHSSTSSNTASKHPIETPTLITVSPVQPPRPQGL